MSGFYNYLHWKEPTRGSAIYKPKRSQKIKNKRRRKRNAVKR